MTPEWEKKKAKFLSKVKKTSFCWIWTGKLNPQGYGYFYLDRDHKGGAHRSSYWLFKGEIPKNILVCHKCCGRDEWYWNEK